MNRTLSGWLVIILALQLVSGCGNLGLSIGVGGRNHAISINQNIPLNQDNRGVGGVVEPVNLERLRAKPISTLYDYWLIDSTAKQTYSPTKLLNDLASRRVLFIGEYHTHQASHKLQLDTIQSLVEGGFQIVLSMEQFSRDSQDTINQYMAGNYGEETLIEEANAWDNYKGSYRAIIDYARQNNIPVVAANAPKMIVRCVGRQGLDAVNRKLSDEQRKWVASNINLDNPEYQEKFERFLADAGTSHGQTNEVMKQRQKNTFAAQLLRDATMAMSIAEAAAQYPKRLVVHLNGAFHSNNHLGTVTMLAQYKLAEKSLVISPVTLDEFDANDFASDKNHKAYQRGDYVYLIKPLPQRFIDKDKEMASINKLIRQRMKEQCEL
ncbi:MAG: ChaN family lipoprotein [Kangiellaceae bacterium]|jgi:uncharacterized iron-regulated protein|nr:ChaN family lipoprotein [Kangiellaceae bacterium]